MDFVFLFGGVILVLMIIFNIRLRKKVSIEKEEKIALAAEREKIVQDLEDFVWAILSQIVDNRNKDGASLLIQRSWHSRISSDSSGLKKYLFIQIFSQQKSLDELGREISVNVSAGELTVSVVIDGKEIIAENNIFIALPFVFSQVRSKTRTIGFSHAGAST